MRISDWSSDVCSSDLAVGVGFAADAALFTIGVELVITTALRERLGGANAGRTGAEEFLHRHVLRLRDVPGLQCFAQRRRVHGRHGSVEQAGADRKSTRLNSSP